MTIFKKICISFFVFVFLILLLIVVNINFSNNGNSFYSSFIYEKASPFKFELSYADKQLLLFKNDNTWFVSENKVFPADTNLVDGFVKTLKEKVLFTPISNKKDAWNEYGLNDEVAFNVKVFDKNNVLLSELYFGFEHAIKNNIAFRSSVDISSFAVENNISSYLENEIAHWALLDIFPMSINQDVLQEIKFNVFKNKSTEESILKKENGNWNLKATNSSSFFATDFSKVSSLITSLASIRALDPNLTDSKLTNDNLYCSLSLLFGDGKTDKINIYSVSADGYYILKRENENFSYIVSSYTIQKINNIFDTKNIID